MDRNSTEYVTVTLSADHDISTDPVSMSFVTPGTTPTTWTSATRITGGAQLLVGPSSPYGSLAPGTYNVFVKITDNPEIPVLLAGQIRIT